MVTNYKLKQFVQDKCFLSWEVLQKKPLVADPCINIDKRLCFDKFKLLKGNLSDC